MAALPRSITRLRRLLLVLLLVLVAAVVGLYFFGRTGRPNPVRTATPTSGDGPEADLTVVGEGFEYHLDEEGRTLFAIRGESYRMDRNDNVFLDDIVITAYSPEGDPYEIESDQAVFDQNTEETLLQGNVRVRGPQGLELTSSRLELVQKGQGILGTEPLRFHFKDDATGRSDRMRVDLAERLFILAGDVEFASTPGAVAPFELRANRLFFERPRHHIRVDGAVLVRFTEHFLKARRVNLWLQEDEENLQFVRALYNVRGGIGTGGLGPAGTPGPDNAGPDSTVPENAGPEDAGSEDAGSEDAGPAGGGVRFRGRTLSAVFEPGTSNVRRFELEGWPWRRAFLLSLARDVPPRRLAAGYIAGTLIDGTLVQAEAFGGVEVAELLTPPSEAELDGQRSRDEAGGERSGEVSGGEGAGAEEGGQGAGAEEEGESEEEDSTDVEVEDRANILRRVTAQRAEAGFGPDGGLTEVSFFENVVFEDLRIHARARQARFDFIIGTGELKGGPVEVTAPQGDLSAPRVLYTQGSGLLYAEGGTRSRLVEASAESTLGGSPLARGEGPVFVEAEKAFLRNDPSSFLYQGNVRAWRGENLILADELQGEETEGRLVAQGRVRTRWVPEPSAGEKPGAGQGGDERESAARGPIEVSAAIMIYTRNAGLITFRGSARAVQGGRILACDEMYVELGEKDEAEVLRCQGNTRIEDRVTGRIVTGDRARYEMGGRSVEVEGERVVLRDREGAEATGRRVTYEFETGIVQIQGRPPGSGPGETSESTEKSDSGQ